MTLAKLSHLTAITVQGEKAATFLQGQLTCDVRDITTQQTRLAAHCNPKGRVVFSLRLITFQGQFHIIVPTSMAQLVTARLEKYAQLSRVQLQVNEKLHILGCYGSATEFFPTLQLPQVADQAIAHEESLLIREPGEPERFLIVTRSNTFEQLLTAENNQWQDCAIHNQIASIYPESSDLFTPHMLNYPALNAVSFKKGCFIGQEIIARTHYLGKAKRHLKILPSPSSQLKPGDKLLDEQGLEIGVVVEQAKNQEFLLAVVPLILT